MELRHLRFFVAVAEELNFTRAAERVFVTQPALSRVVHALEAEVGAPLLERSTRRVTLTPAGRAFLGLARTVLLTLDEGLRDLKATPIERTLRVGVTDYALHARLPEALRDLVRGLENVRVRHVEGSTAEQLAALRAGALDVGFFMAARLRDPALAQRVLARSPLVLAVPGDHPLARLAAVPLAALSGERLLVNSREGGPFMHAYLRRLFGKRGVTPTFVESSGAPVYSFATAMRLVADGEGAFLVHRALAALPAPGVAFRPVRDPEPRVSLRMVWRPALDADVRDALERLVWADGPT